MSEKRLSETYCIFSRSCWILGAMERLMGVREASGLLGLIVVTMYFLTRTRKIPCVKTARSTGGRVLFRESDLQVWVADLLQGARREP